MHPDPLGLEYIGPDADQLRLAVELAVGTVHTM